MKPHATSESVQIRIVGLTRLGSSKLPALTNTCSGCMGEDVKRGEPHSGQNERETRLPLSLAFVNVLTSPRSMRNRLTSKRMPTLNALPVTRRQSAQWQ